MSALVKTAGSPPNAIAPRTYGIRESVWLTTDSLQCHQNTGQEANRDRPKELWPPRVIVLPVLITGGEKHEDSQPDVLGQNLNRMGSVQDRKVRSSRKEGARMLDEVDHQGSNHYRRGAGKAAPGFPESSAADLLSCVHQLVQEYAEHQQWRGSIGNI